MPKGCNPNSLKNLKRFTSADAKINGAKGGKAAASTKRILKTLKQLDMENTTDEERLKMLTALKFKAQKGNLEAFKIYRDLIGEKPVRAMDVKFKNPFEGLTTDELRAIVYNDTYNV